VRIPYWRLVRQSGGKRKGSCPMGCYGLLRLIYYVSLGSRTLPNQTGYWDVWNYRACNFMRDMKAGQQESYVDHSQFDKTDVHYDTSSKADNPRWNQDTSLILLHSSPLTSGTWRSVTLSNMDKDPL
uniref:Uncharacterized protein n=1 Tax=Oncorhynchus kisutch TaxID=8019 RepID=A0A8C7G7G6_ONCKI